MKKILVVLGIVLGAAAATSAVRAEKSNPTVLNGNSCVDCVHECIGEAKECRMKARQQRTECSTRCMSEFRIAMAACFPPTGQSKQECLREASGAFSTCKNGCDHTLIADCADDEQDCLKECVQGPGGNITAARCADLCLVSQP